MPQNSSNNLDSVQKDREAFDRSARQHSFSDPSDFSDWNNSSADRNIGTEESKKSNALPQLFSEMDTLLDSSSERQASSRFLSSRNSVSPKAQSPNISSPDTASLEQTRKKNGPPISERFSSGKQNESTSIQNSFQQNSFSQTQSGQIPSRQNFSNPNRSELLNNSGHLKRTDTAELSQTDSSQTNSRLSDSIQPNSFQTNSRPSDSIQPNSFQTNSRPSDSMQPNSFQTNSRLSDSMQPNSFQTASPQTDASALSEQNAKTQNTSARFSSGIVGQPLLVVDNLCKGYVKGKNLIPVLQHVSLTIRTGEFLAIVGQSGSGKSTLLHLMGTLDRPDSGSIHFGGKRIDTLKNTQRDLLRNHFIGMIFQFYHLIPEMTTLENVLSPLMIRESLFGYFQRRSRYIKEAKAILDLVGLSHRLKHKPRELSGGEMQRAAIARALVTRPKILLADEPTGNLDSKTTLEITALLRNLNIKQNLTIVMVTHDTAQAETADRFVRLVDGQIVEEKKMRRA